MKPSQLLKALEVCRKAGRAPNIQGPPGGGKTTIVKDYADSVGYRLLVLDLPMIYDPVDTRGIPCNVNGATVWLPPEYVYRIITDGDSPWVVFVDDYGTCPPTSQANLMGLFLDRRIGGHPLPESTFVVAAGNRVTDATAVNATPSALSNRMSWLTLSVDLNDFCHYGLTHDFDTSVVAFHRFTGGAALYPMFNDAEVERPCGLCGHTLKPMELCGKCLRNNPAFPTPRTWSFVSDVIKQKPDADIELDLIAAQVGMAKGTEFLGYLRMYRELPSVDTILLGPKMAPVPTSPAAMYAVATALGRMATNGNMDSVCQYLQRCEPEYNVLAVRDAVTRDKTLAETRAFQAWATKFGDVLM